MITLKVVHNTDFRKSVQVHATQSHMDWRGLQDITVNIYRGGHDGAKWSPSTWRMPETAGGVVDSKLMIDAMNVVMLVQAQLDSNPDPVAAVEAVNAVLNRPLIGAA